MKQLQLEESTAKSLYKTGSLELKQILEETFGKKFFIENITDAIKTFEDACQYLNIKTHDDAYKLMGMKREYLKDVSIDKCEDTYLRLCILTLALNEGTEVDLTKEYGYFPWFNHKEKVGSGFDGSVWFNSGNCSSVSRRLALRNSNLAKYSGNQFEQEYYNYMYN